MPFRIVRQVLFRGDMQERITEVSGDMLRIGRGVSNDLQLEDLSVFLHHATITGDEQGRYLLRDLTQTGATYINRAPIEEQVLRHGDRIRIQRYALAVSLDDSSGLLVLTVQGEPRAKIPPSLALMPKLQLAGRRWTKRSIAAVLCLLVVLGSVVAFAIGQRAVFMPGAVSMKHTKFANQCQACHGPVKYVWELVPNGACQGCHEPKLLPPAHFRETVSLTQPPLCTSCHLEHKGQRLLADVQDRKCVQCHGNLKVNNPQVPSLATVHSFMTDHPEFAITRSLPGGSGPTRVRLDDNTLLKDDSALKLNHQRHLELEADYLATQFGVEARRMNCGDCHRSDDEGRTMLSIRFDRDCQRCHSSELEFEGRRIVHGRQLVETEARLLSQKSRQCLKCHETEPVNQAMQPGAAVGRVPNVDNEAVELGAEGGGVAANQPTDKTVTAQQTGTLSVKIRKVATSYAELPGGWMPYSRFDHQAHASLPVLEVKGSEIRNGRPTESGNEKRRENWCVACHQQAPRSMKTEDVLLPSIRVCRQCHREPGGAQARCRSCHDFHVPDLSVRAVGEESGATKVATP